jgi:hypothetical protein
MIVKHPSQPGWLIVTPEAESLLSPPYMLNMDGSIVHPLHFTPADFLDNQVGGSSGD